MTPNAARPARRDSKPNPITTIPAVLKNSGAYFVCANRNEPKEIKVSIGKVPKANMPMIAAPRKEVPQERAANCIDWVKPQGKKKVATPTINGAKNPPSILIK